MRFVQALTSSVALFGLATALPSAVDGDLVSLSKRQTAPLGLSVYWGQPGISVASMGSVCSDPSYSIVNIAFLTNLFGPGGYPSMSVGTYTSSDAQKAANATGLIDAYNLPGAINLCRQNGKKVLLSIGGATGDIRFSAARYASAAATNVWNLFLGGGNSTVNPLRPFRDIVLDGIDLDPENKAPQYYDVFVRELRAKMRADTSRTYLITAAPQCPRNLGSTPGDQSLPDSVLKLCDHVWVQFYNNAPANCNHGQSNFQGSLKSWATAVSPAKVWVGAFGKNFPNQNGYVSNTTLAAEIKAVKALRLSNLGGYMLWNAEGSFQNNNYQKSVRTALNS